MRKKLLFFVSCVFFSSLITTYLFADEKILVPLNKPLLSEKEFNKKISFNLLKPLPKPKKNLTTKPQKVTENQIIDQKFKLLIPKKKPIISGLIRENKIITSKYYKKKDVAIAKKAINEMKKSNWTSALKISKKAKDKSVYNFVQWRHLLTSGNKASFYDYLTFINRNENYPRISRIRYLAEHKLSNEEISPNKIIDWFNQKEPLSGYGKIILGESFILTGKIKLGTNLIKEGWVTADLNKSELRFFRSKFKKYLNADDYIKRADYLAWNNKYWDLKRLLRYLPKDYELLYNARQLLMSKSYGVDTAISKVPAKFKNDSGLNYDRLKWRRKRGRVDSSVEILLKIENTKEYLVRPDKWWIEREILSRSLIYKKNMN